MALLDRADLHHAWAVESFKTLAPPLITCECVLAETLHLVSDLAPSVNALVRLYNDRILQVNFDFRAQGPAVFRLVQKYADLPMDLADACLVRMSELHPNCFIWTTDTHFRVYRRLGRQAIPLLSP